MPYTFTANTNRAFRCLEGITEGMELNDRIALAIDTDGDIPTAIGHMMPELIRKWGMSGMVLQSFRYDAEEGSTAPMFHQGMAQEFIDDFFNDAQVRSLLHVCEGRGKSTSMGEVCGRIAGDAARPSTVEIAPLECKQTDLTMLNRLLHCRSLVRNPPPIPSGESSATEVNKTFRYPTIRQMDVFLSSGVTVSDALREYVMLPDDALSENRERVLDDELADSGTAPTDDADLSDTRAYPLLSPAQKNEFLYHVFWRLVSGGSPLCQFEEDAIYYKLGARELYKDIVCVARRKAVDASARPELVLQSHVFAVKRVLVGPSKKVLPLFPVADDVSPSNSNFAYIIVNPTRREVVWWYNAFSSF